MEGIFKVCVFLIYVIIKADTLRIDYVEDPQETTRQYIFKQISDVKAQMDRLFSSFSLSFNEKLSQMQKEQTEIGLNNRHLLLRRGLPVGVPVKESNGNILTILFGDEVGTKSVNGSYRKHWMLKEPSTTSFTFTIKNNNLGVNDQLSLTGISSTGDTHGYYINTRTPITTEFVIRGFVTFVALTIHPDNPGIFHPNFVILGYHTSSKGIDTWRSCHSQMITREGLQNVSYPETNTQYTNNATSAILITIPSGTEFKMTLKYLDVENSTSCGYDYLKVFSLEDNSSSSSRQKPDPTKRYCGSEVMTSQTVGYSTTAVLFFRSDGSVVRKGYRVEIQPQSPSI